VFLMGDHGGGQDALRAAAKDLEDQYDKLDKTAHIYYVPDLYYKEKQQMKAYLAERGVPYDAHAGTDDTSEVMFLDAKKWVRSEKTQAEHRAGRADHRSQRRSDQGDAGAR